MLGNMSNTVIVDLGYDNMEKMSLVTHLQSLGVTEWHQIRSEVTIPRMIYFLFLGLE